MWIRHEHKLINLSLVKIIQRGRSNREVSLDDLYISFLVPNGANYFLDGIEKILKSNPPDYSVFDVKDIMVDGGGDVK